MSFSVANPQTDGNGVQSWDVTSDHNGSATTVLRVLEPTAAITIPHHLLYVIPVKPGLSVEFGDGLESLRLLNYHNLYNCTIIAPSFDLEPWIANHPTLTDRHYEDFLTLDLHPWIVENFTLPATEDNWVLGFSKSGLAVLHLLYRHPTIYNLGAAWDFPTTFTDPDITNTAYGTQNNFDTNYDPTTLLPGYLITEPSFTTRRRLWIGGFAAFEAAVADYTDLQDSEGALHWDTQVTFNQHHWDGQNGAFGWLTFAMNYLYVMHLEEHYGGIILPSLLAAGFFFV